MADDVEYLERKDGDKIFGKQTGTTHEFRLRRHRAHWLEVEDCHFHHDSAVMMPEAKVGAGNKEGVSGMAALADALRHAMDHPERRLLLAGHTDSSGGDDYNVKLSQMRAEGVMLLLLGRRDDWVKGAMKKHKVEDYQQILTWAAAWLGWPCDPGAVDNSSNKKTQEAVKAFQKAYSGGGFGETIEVDGIVGKHTWGAFFTLYRKRVAQLLDIDEAGLKALGAGLHFTDPEKVGCGPHHPIDGVGKKGFKSATNRRVEVIFFEPGEEPHLKCHAGGGCKPKDCDVYNKKFYTFEFVASNELRVTVRADAPAAPLLARARVRISGGVTQERTTDAAGVARFRAIPKGSYTVHVEREHCEPKDAVTAVTTAGTDLEVRLRPRATVEVLDSAGAVTDFVRVGLWDKAFDARGNLKNAASDAHNFVGADSHRFSFRVTDPLRKGGEAILEWKTVFADGSADDAPGSKDITLVETAAGSEVFVSHPVMLVTNQIDKKQATDSGLVGHAQSGLRSPGQSNHRLRRITVSSTHPLDSSVSLSYAPSWGGAPVTQVVPVFQRSVEERRRIHFHLVNVRTGVGGGPVMGAALRGRIVDLLQSIYAVAGVYAECDEFEIDSPAACNGSGPINTTPVITGASFSSGLLAPSASMQSLIDVVRGRADFQADHVYLVCINRFVDPVNPPGGEALPDAWLAAGSPGMSFAFIGVNSTNDLATAHEATHMTTDLNNTAGGHYDLGVPSASAPGPIDGKNLMQRFVLIANGNISDSKRLWNTAATNSHYSPAFTIPRQVDAIRAVRFTQPY